MDRNMKPKSPHKLSNIIQFNPTERLAKGTLAKKVPMEYLQPYTRAISDYETAEYSGGSKFRNGDTLMARITPCLENGKTAYASILDDGEVGFGSTEYIVFRNIEGVTDSKFVYYFVTSPWFREIAIKSMVGSSGRQRVQQSVLENLEVNLPSLDEQRRIAGILGSLDDKIELNRRINANLEAQAQALFRSWFVDNETQNNNPGFFNDIIQTTLSGDWGQETPKGNYISEVYCIRGADIPDIKCGDKGKLPTRYILEKNLKNKKLSENDLVVEISGGSPTQSTGRICLITRALLDRLGKDVICTNFCRALKPIPDYSFFIYLYWQYLYNNNTMFSYENGTTGIKNLNITDFINKEPIIIPEKKKILEFNKVLQPFFDMIYKNGRESEYLSALRDTLLPKLMTGEIAIE